MSESAVEQQRTILADRRDKASKAKLAAQQAFDASSIEPAAFGSAAPGISPGDRVTKMQGVNGISYDVVSAQGVLKASYSESEVTSEVKALAEANNV